MFSLIIFSVVLMGTMSENYNALYSGEAANAGWEVRADVNGSEVIADFEGELAASGLDTSDVHAIGMTTSPNRRLRRFACRAATSGSNGRCSAQTMPSSTMRLWNSASVRQVMKPTRRFAGTADREERRGYRCAGAAGRRDLGGDPTAFELDGVKAGDQSFVSIDVELVGNDGEVHTVTVIGVISEDISSSTALCRAGNIDEISSTTTSRTSYYLSIGDSSQADDMASGRIGDDRSWRAGNLD